MTLSLPQAHGGELCQLLLPSNAARDLRSQLRDLTSWTLTPRQLCDLELLLVGAFSPLRGFMGRRDVESVSRHMRLAGDAAPTSTSDVPSPGLLWPLPITLDVTEQVADGLAPGDRLVLRDGEGTPLAVLDVEELWPVDREAVAEQVFGSLDRAHPAVAHLYDGPNSVSVGGPVTGLKTPAHYDFESLRSTPAELRQRFEHMGWRRVVAFQTRNPMHRAHVELTRRAMGEHQANLLLHPVVGVTKPGDIDPYTRVRCYKALLGRYPAHTVRLALLPLAMRMAGPREALLHAIVRKNYGCSHFIVGRDHAGPGSDSAGKPFYPPYGAQELVREHEAELGVEMVPFQHMVYAPSRDAYVTVDELRDGEPTATLSGTELRSRLTDDREIPEWFTYPEVARELERSVPPRHARGFTVFFTGLSGAGKSTLAKVLQARLLEAGGRPVTLLDGDIVRQNLSSELGFSRAHRDLNIRRIAFVASEIAKNRGIAICAPIAPYDRTRRQIRQTLEAAGGFVLVHVATPLAACEKRDTKGLYAKARAGLISEFTGISDPYEEPSDAELVLDTTDITPVEGAQQVLLFLERQGYLGARLDLPTQR